MKEELAVLVLGVGNVLFTDEGLGVHALHQLGSRYQFSDNVALMDGGTLGFKLMESIMGCDVLIVLDAVLGGGEPGTLYRLTGDALRKSLSFKNSLHQTDLVDALVCCGFLGKRPDAVVLGMEPGDYKTPGVGLSAVAETKMPALIKSAVEEIRIAGGATLSDRAWPDDSTDCGLWLEAVSERSVRTPDFQQPA